MNKFFKLVSGLGDEKIRWSENVSNLEFAIANVIGDVLTSSGFIAYLGPFTVNNSLLVPCFKNCFIIYDFFV